MKHLLREVGQSPHFRQILSQIKKETDSSLPSPAAVKFSGGVYTLVTNQSLLNNYDFDEQVCIITHELLHLMSFHHCRWRDKNPVLWNIATDCCVNGYLIDSLSDRLREELILPEIWKMPNNKAAEWYYSQLMNKDIGDIAASHPNWYRINTKEAEAKLSNIKIATNNSVGWTFDLPKPAPANWKRLLSNKLRYQCSAKKCYSGKRFSRRYNKPPGKRRSRQPSPIVVAIDISPSISEELLLQFFSHLQDIASQIKTQIIVIECDSAVRRTYEYKEMLQREIGSADVTLVTPALEHAAKIHKKTPIGALVYFTDGDIHDEPAKPTKFPVIWVYPTAGCPRVADWGEHLCLN